MSGSVVLISSWSDGLFALSPDGQAHELKGRCVAGLVSDGRSGAVAVVDGTVLMRRSAEREWSELATSELRMECCLAVDDVVYAGTEGAHLLRVRGETPAERVDGFDNVDGRATWFAGSAVVDGKVVGPPLGVRSLTGSSDGRVLLAGVHVGGIPRSVDGGLTWHPTIDIKWDVHEVCIHPEDPETVIGACAVGLCFSEDGGATWTLDRPGSEVPHCSAVAFSGGDLFVSVSDGPFASHGAVLRRSIDAPGSLTPAGGGLPDRLEGIVDTGCIASKGAELAMVDRGGNVHASRDGGRRWTRLAEGIRNPSSALIV
ncbi:MAG TPA: hypothetical protein VK966_01440 [Longimicrobiales bacterium]|nr:hypothetical protein [Longimicrobiales bacterium]